MAVPVSTIVLPRRRAKTDDLARKRTTRKQRKAPDSIQLTLTIAPEYFDLRVMAVKDQLTSGIYEFDQVQILRELREVIDAKLDFLCIGNVQQLKP